MTSFASTRSIGLLLLVMAGATSATGCKSSKEDFEKWKVEDDARRAASAKARESSAPAAKNAPVELEERTVAKQKVTMQIPKGAKTLAESDVSTTYSLPLDKLFELNIQVLGSGAATLDEAKKRATTLGGVVKTAEEKDGQFVVVMNPTGQLQDIHVYLPKHGAICKGTVARIEELKKICTSIKPAG